MKLIDLYEEELKVIHAKQYTGTDDDMPDDFDRWLCELTDEEINELIK